MSLQWNTVHLKERLSLVCGLSWTEAGPATDGGNPKVSACLSFKWELCVPSVWELCAPSVCGNYVSLVCGNNGSQQRKLMCISQDGCRRHILPLLQLPL